MISDPVALTQYVYDERGRVINVLQSGIAPGSTFGESHNYTYDDGNRLGSYSHSLGYVLAEYEYDDRNQLIGAAESDDPAPDEYAYDDNGNRTVIQDDFGGAPRVYVIGPNNQILSDGTYTYEYDFEGNRTFRINSVTGDSTYYTWDHRNRLKSLVEKDGNGTPADPSDDVNVHSVVNYYDAQNQLVHRARYWDEGLSYEQTSFVHDNGQVVLEFNKTVGGGMVAGDLSHRYLWGPTVDQLFSDEQVDWSGGSADGEVLWALTDHLGSVSDMVDSNGEQRLHRRFDAFGNIVEETHYNASGAAVTAGQAGFVDTAFAFTGRYRDADTGLQNNLHRWYDSTTGSWISEDPIGFAAGDANLYRYVGNQATSITDSSGLQVAIPAPWFAVPAVPVLANPVTAAGVAVVAGPIIGYKVGEWADERWSIGKRVGDWAVPDVSNPPPATTAPPVANASPAPNPQEVSKRQSERRRQVGINEDPDTPIPDLKPGDDGGWGKPVNPTGPGRSPGRPKPRHGKGERGDHPTPKPPTMR